MGNRWWKSSARWPSKYPRSAFGTSSSCAGLVSEPAAASSLPIIAGGAALGDATADAARRRGAQLRTGSKVNALEVRDGRVRAILAVDGRIETDWAILTTPLPIARSLLAPHVPAEYRAGRALIGQFANVSLVLDLKRSLSGTYWPNVNDPSFPPRYRVYQFRAKRQV